MFKDHMDTHNIESIKKSINPNDPYSVENALNEVHKHEEKILEYVPFLVELLNEDWHYKHEDIVLLLQSSKDSRAVDVLYKTALKKYPYLDYDNSYALARKCTWALADIGTPEAKDKLFLLSKVEDEEISNYAKKRLGDWEKEKQRKAHKG